MNKLGSVLILAGGDGDRFWPLQGKLLTPFLGKPLIMHMVKSYAQVGKKVYVVANEGNMDQLSQAVGSSATVIMQDKNLDGMAGAVLSCKGRINGDTLIVGNDIYDFTQASRLGSHLEEGCDMVFIARRCESYFPGGYLIIEQGKVKGIIEKPGAGNTPSPYVKLVADYFRDFESFVQLIENTPVGGDDRYEQALDVIMKQGKASFIEYGGTCNAIKYPWHLLSVMHQYLSNISPLIDKTAVISKTAIITGNVVISAHARIGDFVKIAGPCYIGNHTVIADYSLIRESHIGSDCLIGSSSEVARSYLDNGVSLHRNYVGDSVLGKQVLLGAGAVTANFRFDKKTIRSRIAGQKTDSNMGKLGAILGNGSKVGVNSSIFPGIKVGRYAHVGPGEKVVSDIKDGEVYFTPIANSR